MFRAKSLVPAPQGVKSKCNIHASASGPAGWSACHAVHVPGDTDTRPGRRARRREGMELPAVSFISTRPLLFTVSLIPKGHFRLLHLSKAAATCHYLEKHLRRSPARMRPLTSSPEGRRGLWLVREGQRDTRHWESFVRHNSGGSAGESRTPNCEEKRFQSI